MTFLAFALVVSRIDEPGRRTRSAQLGLLGLNVVFVAGAVALLVGLLPVYAKQEAGVGEDAIGLLFLLNSLLIVGAQVPVAAAQAGRRRMRALARMGMLFAAAWVLVLAAGLAGGGPASLAALVIAIGAFSLAECLYDSVQGPLTADLAPGETTGRYLALNGFSWQLGFIAGPAIGAAILAAEPHALWLAAAAACSLGALGALVLEPFLPDGVRRTPGAAASGALRPRRAATSSR